MTTKILVNERQKGNPVLREIKNVPWEYATDLVPDYQIGSKACAVFISVRYHLLKPEYLTRRLNELRTVRGEYKLRVLLCQVDTDDHGPAMHALNLAAIRSESTLVLAHSSKEAARLLECFKAYENNNAAAIKEKVDKDHLSKLTDALTTVKPLNKTDVVTLARTFGSLKDIVNAPLDRLKECPGLGHTKIHNLRQVFDQPFSAAARTRREQETKKRKAPRQLVASSSKLDDHADSLLQEQLDEAEPHDSSSPAAAIAAPGGANHTASSGIVDS